MNTLYTWLWTDLTTWRRDHQTYLLYRGQCFTVTLVIHVGDNVTGLLKKTVSYELSVFLAEGKDIFLKRFTPHTLILCFLMSCFICRHICLENMIGYEEKRI